MASEGNRGMDFPGSRLGRGAEGSSSSGIAETLKEKSQEFASSVASSAEDAWDSTRQRAQQALTAAGSAAEDAWQSISQFMRTYPLATFCLGLGAGILLTRMLEWSPGTSWSRRQLEHPGRWDDRR